MKLKEPHAIFKNIGISTTYNRNTRYFSFDMDEEEEQGQVSTNDNQNGHNVDESHDNKNDSQNKGDSQNGDNNQSGDNKQSVDDIKNINDGKSKNNSSSTKEEDDKKKFKLNIYKNNPYLRRKLEYNNSEKNNLYNLPDMFLELIIMKEKDFNDLYLSKDIDICCQMKETKEMSEYSPSYTCPGKGYLKRYVDESNMYSLNLPVYFVNDRIKDDNISESLTDVNTKQLLERIENEFIYNIKDTDVYALFLSNCIDSQTFELELHGDIHILNKYGYLPGDKIAKLNLYFIFMIIYTIYFLIWIYMLVNNKQYVIKIQIWILICTFLYIMENLFLYFYFMVYNITAKVNNNLLFLSVSLSILKNVCSYLLILLGSLGWGLVRPTLDKKTSLKIKILFFFFIIFDFIKHFLDIHLTDTKLNTIYFFFCTIPITVIYSIIYLWVFASASKIIIQLNEDKQYEKLNMFKNFFNVLIFTVIFSVITLIIDIIAIFLLDNTIWNIKCYINEGLISCLFIIILTAMFILFKPSDRLKRIAHFTEIGDMDEMEDFTQFRSTIDDVS
uniref:GOST seven transmembrane domain-containing protein n=1 Tax=Piliocolobus tephrosceles TaxID=591936 RepID=A0A8C9GMQ1_9PRIM